MVRGSATRLCGPEPAVAIDGLMGGDHIDPPSRGVSMSAFIRKQVAADAPA